MKIAMMTNHYRPFACCMMDILSDKEKKLFLQEGAKSYAAGFREDKEYAIINDMSETGIALFVSRISKFITSEDNHGREVSYFNC